MEGMTTAITSLFSVMTTSLTEVTSNPTLAIFFYASLVGIGIGILRKLKRV